MTFIPESPDYNAGPLYKERSASSGSIKPFRRRSLGSINSLCASHDDVRICARGVSPVMRRSSIGSASSLNDGRHLGLLSVTGNSRMGQRRVSEISIFNQLKNEMGVGHITSEFYEMIRIDPDNISLDSIHEKEGDMLD